MPLSLPAQLSSHPGPARPRDGSGAALAPPPTWWSTTTAPAGLICIRPRRKVGLSPAAWWKPTCPATTQLPTLLYEWPRSTPTGQRHQRRSWSTTLTTPDITSSKSWGGRTCWTTLDSRRAGKAGSPVAPQPGSPAPTQPQGSRLSFYLRERGFSRQNQSTYPASSTTGSLCKCRQNLLS